MSKQLFFKLKGQELCPLSLREQTRFAENLNIEIEDNNDSIFKQLVNDELYVSFAFDKTEDDMVVHIWAGDYSIALTHKEFMNLYKVFNDKDLIEQKIIADGI